MFSLHLLLYDYNWSLQSNKPSNNSVSNCVIIFESENRIKSDHVMNEESGFSHQKDSLHLQDIGHFIHPHNNVADHNKIDCELIEHDSSGRSALSLNAATLAIVLLGSRLEHALDVFAFITFAMS